MTITKNLFKDLGCTFCDAREYGETCPSWSNCLEAVKRLGYDVKEKKYGHTEPCGDFVPNKYHNSFVKGSKYGLSLQK